MLTDLRVKNLAIIEDLSLRFDEGLIIITGETGAGKTLLVEALELVLGGKAEPEIVGSHDEYCFVEGTFLPSIEALSSIRERGIDIDLEDGHLTLSREIHGKGRSRGYIGGRTVGTGILIDAGELLVDLHGQHEHQSLFKQKNQQAYFDSFGGPDMIELKKKYQIHFKRYKDLTTRLMQKMNNMRESQRMLERYHYEKREIEDANLRVGEEEELKSDQAILTNYSQFIELLEHSREILAPDNSDEGVLDKVRILLKNFESLERIDERLSAVKKNVMDAQFLLMEINDITRRSLESFNFDPNRLDEVNSRLSKIYELKRKYGDGEVEILDYLAKIKSEIAMLENIDESIQKDQEELKIEVEKSLSLAKDISRKRLEIKAYFENKVSQELEKLAMKAAVFEVRIQPVEQPEDPESLTSDGLESVEFYISTNPGEEPKPLNKIVSGGELSRLMMAIKIALSSQKLAVTCMIFDEIDSGIGGNTAFFIGEKLFELSRNGQVICITHLPQIACFADHHFVVDKTVIDDKTKVSVKKITDNEVIAEIVRMLSGEEAIASAIEHARELVEVAASKKMHISNCTTVAQV